MTVAWISYQEYNNQKQSVIAIKEANRRKLHPQIHRERHTVKGLDYMKSIQAT